jgi:hypothetical protein
MTRRVAPELKQRFHRALQAAWQAIGSEVLECGGGSSMPRSDVVEVVLDADYIKMYGGLAPADYDAWRELSYTQRKNIARETFTYKSYGMRCRNGSAQEPSGRGSLPHR